MRSFVDRKLAQYKWNTLLRICKRIVFLCNSRFLAVLLLWNHLNVTQMKCQKCETVQNEKTALTSIVPSKNRKYILWIKRKGTISSNFYHKILHCVVITISNAWPDARKISLRTSVSYSQIVVAKQIKLNFIDRLNRTFYSYVIIEQKVAKLSVTSAPFSKQIINQFVHSLKTKC